LKGGLGRKSEEKVAQFRAADLISPDGFLIYILSELILIFVRFFSAIKSATF